MSYAPYISLAGGEKKPSQDNPDPVMFEYNGWGKNCLVNITRKKNRLQCQGQETSDATPSLSTQMTQAEEVFVFDQPHYGPEVEIDINNPVVIPTVTGN